LPLRDVRPGLDRREAAAAAGLAAGLTAGEQQPARGCSICPDFALHPAAVYSSSMTWQHRAPSHSPSVLLSCAGIAAVTAPVASNASQPTQQQRLVSPTLGLYETAPSSRCSAAAQALMLLLADGLQAQNAELQLSASKQGDLQRSSPLSTNSTSAQNRRPQATAPGSRSTGTRFLAQPGYVDFGFAGTLVTAAGNNSSSSKAECEPSCSFTNPTAAYGVTILPLSPQEDARLKILNPATPRHEAQNLDGRYGPRLAPSWQLRQDEVVLLLGCTPPAEASRCVLVHRLAQLQSTQCSGSPC
jgi:hypothetical protein